MRIESISAQLRSAEATALFRSCTAQTAPQPTLFATSTWLRNLLKPLAIQSLSILVRLAGLRSAAITLTTTTAK